MKRLRVEFTVEELTLLAALASDQLFRREFIDPKMPGYKGDPAEVALGKDLVLRLKAVIRQVSGAPNPAISRRQPNHFSPNTNGIPDAV